MTDRDTSLRVQTRTKQALIKARAQMVLKNRPVRSDNDTILALIEHWEQTADDAAQAAGEQLIQQPC